MPQSETILRTEDLNRAIALVKQLPSDKLTTALTFLEQLTHPPDPNETHLRQIIQQFPNIDRLRLEDLRDRCEWGNLTPEEHQELMDYEDQIEQHNVDRLQAMMQLAELKNIDLPTLNQQFRTDRHHAS
jgi:hypothetical protein